MSNVKIVFGQDMMSDIKVLSFQSNSGSLNIVMDSSETRPYSGVVLDINEVDRLIIWLENSIKN